MIFSIVIPFREAFSFLGSRDCEESISFEIFETSLLIPFAIDNIELFFFKTLFVVIDLKVGFYFGLGVASFDVSLDILDYKPLIFLPPSSSYLSPRLAIEFILGFNVYRRFYGEVITFATIY